MGISHPITENSKLFFNYGHFQQLPSYEQLYQLSRGASDQMRLYGNPSLPFAKTISYELGYDQALFDEYLLQIAGFYHDITDQLASTRYLSADGRVSYDGVNSNNYNDIMGFEISLKKMMGKWFKGFINYTYQVISYGRFGKDIIYEDPSAQREFDANTGNFSQNRPLPQPCANMVLTFFTPRDFGDSDISRALLSKWALTVIGEWRAGWWATRNSNQISNLSQNVQVKDTYRLNFRLSKIFTVGPVDISLLLDVNNVLNTRQLSLVGFYDNQDFEDYWNSLHLPQSNGYNNIVGDDRYGEFRNPSVEYQPIVQINNVDQLANPSSRPFFYETSTGRYMEYNNDTWSEVDNSRVQKVIDDKAYIDMPNQTSFNFLNPRNIYIGIKTSFRL